MSACWSLRRQAMLLQTGKSLFSFAPWDLKLIRLATKKQTPIAALRLPSLRRNASTKGREESRLRPALGPLGACRTWRGFVGGSWLILALASAARLAPAGLGAESLVQHGQGLAQHIKHIKRSRLWAFRPFSTDFWGCRSKAEGKRRRVPPDVRAGAPGRGRKQAPPPRFWLPEHLWVCQICPHAENTGLTHCSSASRTLQTQTRQVLRAKLCQLEPTRLFSIASTNANQSKDLYFGKRARRLRARWG